MTAITRNLKNRLCRPGTTEPIVNHRVSIRLNTPGFIDDGTVGGTQTTEQTDDLYVWTDATGLWVAPIVPNTYINPADSWYSVKEFKNTAPWAAVVPDGGAGTDVWLEACLVDAPTNPTPIIVQSGLPLPTGTPTIGQVPTVTQVSPLELDWETGGGGGAVSSVFTRTGAVVAQSGDYTAAQVGADASGAAAAAQSAAIAAAATDATSKVATEATARASADTTLQTNITNEATTRASADTTNANAITAEASTRAAADSTNATAITTETTRAEAAEALLAPLASPALTGTPTAPTKAPSTNNTDIATTAYADAAVAVETSRATTAEGTKATSAALTSEISRATAAEALLAPLASPALTGTPTGPTKAPATNSTALATTAYADAAVAVEASRATTAEGLLAPLASPALTGSPTAPTKTALDNSTKLATTAYADSAVAVEATARSNADALKAPLASPALTGSPTAPTQSTGDNSTKLATTAYVDTGLGTKAAALTRQARTSNFTAALSEIEALDTTGGTFVATLPAASGGKGRIVLKWTAGTVAPSIALSGSDHFNTSTGATSATPSVLNQGYQLESDGTSIWTVTADDLPLSALDTRYISPAALVYARMTWS